MSESFNPGAPQASDFTKSAVDPASPRQAWARYAFPSNSPVAANMGAIPSGDRIRASSAATDFALTNPTIASLIESSIAQMIGAGLRVSSKPDAGEIGITDAQAATLSREIERQFSLWASSASDCDATGRMTLDELVNTAARSALIFGEVLAIVTAARSDGLLTKVQLLDPRLLDSAKNQHPDASGMRVVAGVQFNGRGAVEGYWLHDHLPSHLPRTESKFVSAWTPWGRPRVLHFFEQVFPSQVRGVSPLISALTPAHERAVLQEMVGSNIALQSLIGVTLTSELPPAQAVGAFEVDHVGSNGTPVETLMKARAEYHQQRGRIELSPSAINVLMPGEKLSMNTIANPSAEYQDFDKSLKREAASAIGGNYNLAFNDLESVSFSASRMGSELPYRVAVRRRNATVGRLMRAIYAAVVEELIQRRRIAVPAGAMPFASARAGWTRCAVLGPGRVQPDDYKAAQASILAVAGNLSTLEKELGDRGLDLSEVLEQRATENALLQALGLPLPSVDPQAQQPADNPDAADQTDAPARRNPNPMESNNV